KERGVGVFTLEVDSENTSAIGLYEGFGFVAVGRRKGFYENEQSLIMKLKCL
ncbi:MAG: ribosomal-protein-alanine N-acetyltransferase, partial [Firmicutes bacterium HGW-Firmicutes-21]